MAIVEQVKTLIQQKSDAYQVTNPGHYDFWNGHLKYVYQEATDLAQKYNADIEIVQLGALLHDIALLDKVGTKADHHTNGKMLAKQILQSYDYPADKAERVLGCVLHHRSSQNAENIEELCVADADILAHFDCIPMLFNSAYMVHGLKNMQDVSEYMMETFNKDYNDLSDRTKSEFLPRYQTICKVIFGG